MSSRLERQILEVLRPRVGERLEAVQYRCYDDEATLEDLSDPDLLLEELLFRFTGGDIFVTWAEDAGLEFLFTVQTLTSSQFHAGSLESYDAREVPYFRSLVGQPLVSAVVFGWNATPFGIRFTFLTGSVSVGSGDHTLVEGSPRDLHRRR